MVVTHSVMGIVFSLIFTFREDIDYWESPHLTSRERGFRRFTLLFLSASHYIQYSVVTMCGLGKCYLGRFDMDGNGSWIAQSPILIDRISLYKGKQ